MNSLIDNPVRVLIVGLVLAGLALAAWLLTGPVDLRGLIAVLLRFVHVVSAMVWVGLIFFVPCEMLRPRLLANSNPSAAIATGGNGTGVQVTLIVRPLSHHSSMLSTPMPALPIALIAWRKRVDLVSPVLRPGDSPTTRRESSAGSCKRKSPGGFGRRAPFFVLVGK